ncbi:MAG: NADPH-dependent FMN reductase [Leptospirales bacterium]
MTSRTQWRIPVLIGSVRRGRQTPKAALFVKNRMEATGKITSELIDLREINLPVMEERLSYREDPPPGLQFLSDKIRNGDGLVLVSPEYNNGIPGVLKNALDYLYEEFHRKPVAIVTVSSGPYGGINALAQLRLVLLAMGANPISTRLPIGNIEDTLDENGTPPKESLQKRADELVIDLLWSVQKASEMPH